MSQSTITAFLCAAVSIASAQQAFKTPDEAASALASAAKTGDMKALETVLGPDGEDIVSSGDEVADAATRQKFVVAYDAKHQIKMDGDNKAIMVIGQDDFPLPIPLARKDGTWRFDTAAGREEILFRRIGKNELDAIQACLAYVDAQNEYAEKDRTGAGVKTYAQRIVSQPGTKDGLYWPTSSGEEPSPLGELVAQATAQGYASRATDAIPRVLFQNPDQARTGRARRGDGLCRRRQHDRRLRALRLSRRIQKFGCKDIICNHAGTVYEKDLGPNMAETGRTDGWLQSR